MILLIFSNCRPLPDLSGAVFLFWAGCNLQKTVKMRESESV